MDRKINYPQLLLVAVVMGVIAGLCAFAFHAIFHVSTNLVRIVGIVAAVLLGPPIYKSLKHRGVLK